MIMQPNNVDQDWPSKRVTKGGIFHPHKCNYSKETQDLIKLLMEEQKMTIFQRNKVNYHLRNGDALPPPKQNDRPRQYRTRYQEYEDQLAYEIMQRAKVARKRSFDKIQASGAFETEKYTPIHHLREPSEKQKLRLQQHMSGVKERPELDGLKLSNKHKYKRQQNSKDQSPKEQITDLLQEIYERADWLAEMEELGEGKKHRDIIHAQIAERLRIIKQVEKRLVHQQEDLVAAATASAAASSRFK